MTTALRSQTATAVLAPAGEATLRGLGVSPGFESYFGGDVDRIGRMLHEIAGTPDGRLSVAVGKGAEIVGFLGVLPPRPGDRFYPIHPCLEVVAFEVVVDRRGEGVFEAMFQTLFEGDLEELILYVIADPVLRAPGETPRRFRDRLSAVLGPRGFVPLPTDYERANAHRDSAFLARIGRGVAESAVEDFLKRLRAEIRASVAIAVRRAALRTLLRADLERGGFDVQQVTSNGETLDADVVITDHAGPTGRSITVRLNGDEQATIDGSVIWFPVDRLEGLGDVLRGKLASFGGGHG